MLWHMPRRIRSPTQRQVQLFKNGRNQAVRIPREFELPGTRALLRKEGNRLVLQPLPSRSLLEILDALPPLNDPTGAWPPIPALPIKAVDL
jgi:antitoxin VapB